MTGMSRPALDIADHYFVMVGQLLDNALIGGVLVRLTLRDGVVVQGVPHMPAAAASVQELDDTGYPRWVTLGGRTVDMTEVREATIVFPPALP